MPIAAVVADANVLLSAAIGKAALRVFTEYGVVVHASEFNLSEVEEYLPQLVRKYRLPEDSVFLHWRGLPIVAHAPEDYASELAGASQALQDRDPDDAHPLALARTLGLPLWSNDRDLRNLGVECYPTARILKMLEEERSSQGDPP